MTDLEIIKNHPEYLIVPHGISFREWWDFRRYLYGLKQAKEKAEIACVLQTMDWLFAGEEMFGHEASQGTDFVQEEMGWSARTYTEYRRIWERFPPDHRIEGLGITHYQAVAALPPRTARELLISASENNLTRDELRKAVRANLPADDPRVPAVTRRDIENAARRLLQHVQPAGDAYRARVDDVLELALLLDVTVIELVVESGQEAMEL